MEKLRAEAESRTVVLLDYNTNCDIEDDNSPMSHAYLIKSFIEGCYPVGGDTKVNATPGFESSPIEFSPGQRLRSPRFGEGTVMEIIPELGRIVVNFDSEGQKTLSIRLAKLEMM